ncbi:MAG: tetratricopeptide repeat protein [Trueperaceae bacterium]|nr:tetratricopeptide repeat protein [Trueperaceae bacterium]
MVEPTVPPLRFLRLAILAPLLFLAGVGQAQGFDADRYLAQCLRFEAGGDYSSAREACRNALEIEDGMFEAELALARVEVASGNGAVAESRLQDLLARTEEPEPALLLARIALDGERPGVAEAHLAEARTRMADTPDRQLQARLSYLSGAVAEAQGRVTAALEHYENAVSADGLDVTFRLAAAELRLRTGEPEAARQQLESYQRLSGNDRDPRVRSLLGRALWAEGSLGAAAGQLETALALWGTRDTAAQSSDLRTLGLVYLGQGDVQSGTLALREAGRRGNQLLLLSGNVLAWLLVLLAVLVAHLLAESRIESRSTLEVSEGPQPWSVGRVYGVLVLSALAAVAVAVGVGALLYDNMLAAVTPHQQTEVRAVMMLVFTLVAILLSVRTVRQNGWNVARRLFGASDTWAAGVGLGLLLLVVTTAYLAWRPDAAAFGPLWANLADVGPLLILALLALPFSELVFRPFAFDALEHRYDRRTALLVSAGLSTLLLATPVLLLLPFGLVLGEAYRRSRSGTLPLAAMLTLHVGLLVATVVSPWARALVL